MPLQEGDILLKRAEWSAAHFGISLGQALGNLKSLVLGATSGQGLGGAKARTVHAAIYTGNNKICESSGDGLEENQFGASHHTWKIYRHRHRPQVAKMAAIIARDQVLRAQDVRNEIGGKIKNYGHYDTVGAVASALNQATPNDSLVLKSKVKDALNQMYASPISAEWQEHRTCFCSNFVVMCYSMASEMFNNNPCYAMPFDYEKTSPSDMAVWFESERGQQLWQRFPDMIG